MSVWAMAKAKAQFSEVVHEAEVTGPQTLLRSGREVAVIISIKDWKRMSQVASPASKPRQSMAEFIMNSPLHGSGIVIERLKMKPRKLEL